MALRKESSAEERMILRFISEKHRCEKTPHRDPKL